MSAPMPMLAEVPMFELMDEHERQYLSGLLEQKHFDKGDTIFRVGDVGDCVYIVREGRVEIFLENYLGTKIILRDSGVGEVFGDISMLDNGPRTATVVAMEDTECLAIDREALLELVTKHPHAGLDLLSVMARRLRATNDLLRTQVSRNLNDEEEELLTFGQRIADKVAEFGGSWTFIISFGLFLTVWMGINVYLGKRAFDEYPFILLNLCLSALAALQAPVIMMSQNRQAAKDRLNADLDYEVNLKAELEVAQLHSKVDKIYEEMQAQFSKMQKSSAPGR